ncbi:unnamed protein product [Miscanthus lutarioriparius]|uniref:FRIGIDA-like protein n=1 Tax=Miscanthus lutarioriparius TaxID=422564 RepID=A0A811QUH3_9POAL|nr:unnamed protein product [Miscanthus lutarioriparius]
MGSDALDSLHRRETSIDASISGALEHLHSISADATAASSKVPAAAPSDSAAAVFLGFVVACRKEADALRAEMPPTRKLCVDPAKFVMDAVADVFPVDRREVRNRTSAPRARSCGRAPGKRETGRSQERLK